MSEVWLVFRPLAAATALLASTSFDDIADDCQHHKDYDLHWGLASGQFLRLIMGQKSRTYHQAEQPKWTGATETAALLVGRRLDHRRSVDYVGLRCRCKVDVSLLRRLACGRHRGRHGCDLSCNYGPHQTEQVRFYTRKRFHTDGQGQIPGNQLILVICTRPEGALLAMF